MWLSDNKTGGIFLKKAVDTHVEYTYLCKVDIKSTYMVETTYTRVS